MHQTLHDIRNDLAVAIGTVHALIDGKMQPDQERLGDILEALESVDAQMSTLRAGAVAEGATGKELLLHAVIEGSPYAKVLVDRSGRIVLVNRETEKLFGYSRDELLNGSVEMLVPQRFRHGHPALRNAFNHAAVARPMGAGRDLYGRRKDGSEVSIEIGLNPIETEAGSYTLVAITDITERKRAEELRLLHAGVQRHAVELEELNRELASASRFKTQFVATMSHELRTPLAAIIGSAELLSKGKLGERERINVQTIVEAAEALFALINSVLDFSKIEAGRLDLQAANFEVEAVLEGAAEVVAQMARDKGLTLHTYIGPGIPALRGDADRLRQILLNLLGNAVKFTERGQVVARVFALEAVAGEVVLRFEVQDTGIGIAGDVVTQLFEPFVQADDSTSRRFGGTGLGLSIAKRLVQLMGGEINVQSEPDRGALFWFTARFAAGDAPLAAQRRTLEGIGGLILSGDEVFAQIVERYMTSWSMESRRALSREHVVTALQTNDSHQWVAIVDLDNIGVADLGVTLDIVRAILPARVVAVGNDAQLRKPLRQSQLFDAIVRAVDIAPPPVHSVSPAAETKEAEPATYGKVLVAEDNQRLQRLLKLQFDDLGVAATFVPDGRAALEALRRETYALVFMDCQMPHMDGLTATRAIREAERQTGAHVPIAAMTANAFAEDRDACIAAGMDDYLSKPVRLADLRAMIERWAKRPVRSS